MFTEPLLGNGLHNTVFPLLLGADDIENTASYIVECWTVFAELLPGNALIKSPTIFTVLSNQSILNEPLSLESYRGLGFNLRVVHVGFVVDQMAWKQVSLRNFRVYTTSFVALSLHNNPSSVTGTAGLFVYQSQPTKTKLRGFSPQTNYTDRVTAACRRI
jgi:hypothetical protein